MVPYQRNLLPSLLSGLLVALTGCSDPQSLQDESEPPPLVQGDGVYTMGDSVVDMVNSIMGKLRETKYTNTGYVANVDLGVLHLDCSYWVKQVLTRVSQSHYDELPKSSSSGKTALAKDYYDHFVSLSALDPYWKRIDHISQAQPGDIIAYKYDESAGHSTTGHVMILYSHPHTSTCSDSNQHWVYVSDAARSGHGNDTRNRKGPYADDFSYQALDGSGGKPSGVGIGQMWFNTGSSAYYRWSSCGGTKHSANIAIGRLQEPEG